MTNTSSYPRMPSATNRRGTSSRLAAAPPFRLRQSPASAAGGREYTAKRTTAKGTTRMTHERIPLEDLRVPWRALVVLADGRRARLLRNTGTPRHISFETELEMEQENPSTREQGTDRPGRFPGVDGVSRGAVE